MPVRFRDVYKRQGLKLGRLMKESYGPAMQVLQGIKKELDPNGIMNPYKMGL